MSSLGPVLECITIPKTHWVFLSAGERQSKALMNKAKMHARAMDIGFEELESEFKAKDGTVYNVLEIHWNNESWIFGLPANPDTARGYSANLLLDEFALHRDSKEIWAALFPTVTRGYKIQILSTFKGKENKFFDLFETAPTLQKFNGTHCEYMGERGGWSKHFVSIGDAIEMGLDLKDEDGQPIEMDDLKLSLNDDDIWAEEFELDARDEAGVFLSHETISSVTNSQLIVKPAWIDDLFLSASRSHAHFKKTSGQHLPLPLHLHEKMNLPEKMYVGYDVARHRDLAVIWIDALIGGKLRSHAIIDMLKTPFHMQRVIMHTILKWAGLRRACIDKTGIGEDIAESCIDLVGSKAEAIDFTTANKEILAIGLKTNFQNQMSEIPENSVIRRSLHSVKKSSTGTGHFRFDAKKTEETGHADHFWAKALSVQAASQPMPTVPIVTSGATPEPVIRGY